MASFTTLISFSSFESVKIYESLKAEITSIERSQINLQELVDAAEKNIKDKFAPAHRSTYTYRKDGIMLSVSLSAVMNAMLTHAEECGGDSGKRYVASAIVACSRKDSDGEIFEALVALGVTWLTHLLFIFIPIRRINQLVQSKSESDEEPYAVASLSRQTTSPVEEGVGRNYSSFRNNIPKNYLQPSRILSRAICELDRDLTLDSFRSAATTFDILVNFARLSAKTLEELSDDLDDVSNGMMLQLSERIAFDRHNWCLKKTEIENVYAVKIFKNVGISHVHENNLVTFSDHSAEVRGGSSERCIPLPNPHYLAIHAAIAEILHESGAKRFIDDLLNKHRDEGEFPAVGSWPELEKVMEEEALKNFIAESLHLVQTY